MVRPKAALKADRTKPSVWRGRYAAFALPGSLLKKFLPRRANHLHNFNIENSSPRRETGRGLFQSDGDPHFWAHHLPIEPGVAKRVAVRAFFDIAGTRE